MSVDSKRLCLPIIPKLNGVNKQSILQTINLQSSNRRHLHNSLHVSSQGSMPSLDASLTERHKSQLLNHSRAVLGSSTAPSCRDLIAQSLTKKKMPISLLSVTKYKNLLSVPDNDPKHPDISMHIPIDNEETQFFIQSSALNAPAQPGMIPLRNLTKTTLQDTNKDTHVTVFIPFRNSKEINKHEFLKLHSDNPTFQTLDFTSLQPNSTNRQFLEQKQNDNSNNPFADHSHAGNSSSVNTSSSNLNDHSVNILKKRKRHHDSTSTRLPSTVELSLLHNKDILQQLNSNLQWESQVTYENVSDQLQQQEQRIKSMPIIRKYPIFKKHVPTAAPTPHNNPPMSPTRRGSPMHRKSQLKIPSANVVASGINLQRLDTVKGVLTTKLLEQPNQNEEEEKKVRFIPTTNPGNYLVYWYTFEQNNWKPEIRELQSMVIESKRAYIFGGVGKELYNQLFELDLEQIKWNELKGDAVQGSFPSARFGHSCDLYKRNLVFFGGENRPNSMKFKDCLLDVFTFSLENKQWRQLTCSGGPPQPRKSHASVVVGRNLLIHGGVNNKDTSLKDMWLLDLGTLTWSEAEVAGEVELSFHKCVGVYHSQRCGKVNLYKFIELKVTKWGAQIEQEGVYFFGGKNTKGEASDELRVLKTDCKPMQWLKPETKGIPPKGRYGHSMTFSIEHNVIAIFGGKNDLENDVYLNDLHLLSLDTFSWVSVQTAGSTPAPRFNHSAAIYDSKLIVFGGINIDGFLPPSINILELDTVISQKMHEREIPGGLRSSSVYNNLSGLQHSVSITQNIKQNRSSITDKNIRFDSIPFSEHMKEIQAENFDENKVLVNQLSFGNFKSFLPVPRYNRQPTKKNTTFIKQPVLYNPLTNQAITPTSSPKPPLQYE